MKSTKDINLYRLFRLLSRKRKNQIYFLFLLLIINGISESISMLTIIPFLTLITSGNDIKNLPNLTKFLPLNINNYSEILNYITILFCIFIFISVLLRILNNWYILRLTAKINIDLSNRIFKKNIYQSYLNYTKKSSPVIISLISEKINACSSALNSIFIICLGFIIGLFIISTLLFINWKIVFISLLVLIMYYLIISRKVRSNLFKNGQIISIYSPRKIKIIQESFNGFRDIVINGTEKIYIDLFNKYNSISRFKEADSQLYILLPKFLIEGFTLLIISIAGYSFSISNSQNTAFIPLLGSFVYALQRLLPLIQLAYASWAGYKFKSASIAEVLKELEDNINEDRSLFKNNKLNFKKDIVFKKVVYSYDNSRKILDNLDISIRKGDHVGIYGETGSGKSTFLDLFMGLIPPSDGQIFIDDVDIHKNEYQSSWTSMISHVPQIIFLKEGTIAENIAFGETENIIDYDLLNKSAKAANIYEFINKSDNGLKTAVGERGIRLSGGQRQRIAIARALYKKRNILVLDEATSALDEATEKKIIDNIINTHKNYTIIMVTHRVNSLKNCNRIFRVTSKGEIVEE